jgi:hypothetical protein
MDRSKLIDRMDSFGDWLEKVIMDVIIGSLIVILVITAVRWIDGQMDERLTYDTKPPIERRR